METREDNVMSLFERNSVGGLECIVRLLIRVSGGFILCIVISNKLHRQLFWYIDAVNIVFTFLCAVFYICHHPLGFLKDEFLD